MTAYYHSVSHVSFCSQLAQKIVQDCKAGFAKKKCYIVSDLRNRTEIEQMLETRCGVTVPV